MPQRERLHGSLSTVEYFTFGFGTMIGVGWLVLMDDWLTRGGPLGGILGYLLGGLLLFPIAHTYGRLVQRIQDAGAEIAYTEGVMPASVSFAAGWTMVLSYAIVCPWEAVATGNLLARVFPSLNTYQLYVIDGSPIYAPRLAVGLALTLLIAGVNYRGIKPSGLFQDVMTFGLLATFAIFTLLGFARGSFVNMQPLFAPNRSPWLGIFLVLQIVPYFMTGFESVAKGSEEAREGFDPRDFAKAIYAALTAGFLFYVIIIAVVTYVYPWREIVSGHVRTEVAFERTFGSHAIAQLILFGAFLSLLKIFNGNFVAATRMVYALGVRRVAHPSLGRVHPRFGTPAVAVTLVALVTVAGAMMGDAILVPITEVGSLTVGIGWLSACVAYVLRSRSAEASRASERGNSRASDDDRSAEASGASGGRGPRTTADDRSAEASRSGERDNSRASETVGWSARLQPSETVGWIGAAVSGAIIVMKIVPGIPGSFTRAEWIAFVLWCAIGAGLWLVRPGDTKTRKR
jgi:APA family basic amino acid/polyamine antiporter